jgi:hypothetical protein
MHHPGGLAELREDAEALRKLEKDAGNIDHADLLVRVCDEMEKIFDSLRRIEDGDHNLWRVTAASPRSGRAEHVGEIANISGTTRRRSEP